MDLRDFNYDLPAGRVAQFPAGRRDDSKLMVLRKTAGIIEHRRFSGLADFLDHGDVLVLNDTKVLKARLFGKRKTGGKIELIVYKDFINNRILSLVKGGVRDGERIDVDQFEILMKKIGEGFFEAEFLNGRFEEVIELCGRMPLPPYIKRQSGEIDDDRYQTVFGAKEGAVAAPTAALHFSEEMLDGLKKKGVKIVFITLHVGPGTFLPVKTERVEDHLMLPEYYELSGETAGIINDAKGSGKNMIFCGTTVVRAVEDACVEGRVVPQRKQTEIFMYPGYRFKMVEHMLTNFHLPCSTPLLLVSALAGKDKIFNAYKEAIESEYRFFSYGDAMLIW
jgi:S-adenosylmethionine:tRNA ribosyltransferase-isomerase